MTPGPRLRIATRGSALALWQANHIAGLLGTDDCELVIVETAGDKRRDVPIWEVGGTGVFVKEVQAAVLDGRADLAVHSAKDLPSSEAPGLVIAAVPERADPRDCLVGAKLADLAPGALVATGSVRRRVQLIAARPDLTFTGLRGNIDTRLAKAKDFGAIVMACAALHRLARTEVIAEVLEPEVMLPQVAQGALAVECRSDDESTRERLAAIEHRPSRLAVDAERAFLAELGSGCDLPVGAYATVDGSTIELEALIASLDGHLVMRSSARGGSPQALGTQVAADLLDGSGARQLLLT